MKVVETGSCILHTLLERSSEKERADAPKPDVEPIEAITMALVVGVQMSACGILPPLCPHCERFLRATLKANGILLMDAGKDVSDAIKESTGGRFVRVDVAPPGSKDSS